MNEILQTINAIDMGLLIIVVLQIAFYLQSTMKLKADRDDYKAMAMHSVKEIHKYQDEVIKLKMTLGLPIERKSN
tara:strand:- start:313 stop:537 length:225 start_codon:yes stop_codon:yes gene_type:complete